MTDDLTFGLVLLFMAITANTKTTSIFHFYFCSVKEPDSYSSCLHNHIFHPKHKDSVLFFAVCLHEYGSHHSTKTRTFNFGQSCLGFVAALALVYSHMSDSYWLLAAHGG